LWHCVWSHIAMLWSMEITGAVLSNYVIKIVNRKYQTSISAKGCGECESVVVNLHLNENTISKLGVHLIIYLYKETVTFEVGVRFIYNYYLRAYCLYCLFTIISYLCWIYVEIWLLYLCSSIHVLLHFFVLFCVFCFVLFFCIYALLTYYIYLIVNKRWKLKLALDYRSCVSNWYSHLSARTNHVDPYNNINENQRKVYQFDNLRQYKSVCNTM